MKTLADFTPEQLEEAIALKKQIATLEARLATLSEGNSVSRKPRQTSLRTASPTARAKTRRQLSPEARAKIAAAAKARWAKAKAKGKSRL
jgi:hypothetical protein